MHSFYLPGKEVFLLFPNLILRNRLSKLVLLLFPLFTECACVKFFLFFGNIFFGNIFFGNIFGGNIFFFWIIFSFLVTLLEGDRLAFFSQVPDEFDFLLLLVNLTSSRGLF